jgi:hypothetical protein
MYFHDYIVQDVLLYHRKYFCIARSLLHIRQYGSFRNLFYWTWCIFSLKIAYGMYYSSHRMHYFYSHKFWVRLDSSLFLIQPDVFFILIHVILPSLDFFYYQNHITLFYGICSLQMMNCICSFRSKLHCRTTIIWNVFFQHKINPHM